jgi:hypothetical protein
MAGSFVDSVFDGVTLYNTEAIFENPRLNNVVVNIRVFYPTYYITLSGGIRANVENLYGRGARRAGLYLWNYTGDSILKNADFDKYDRWWAGTASSCTGIVRFVYTVKGKVMDHEGRPVAGARITVTDNQGNVYQTTSNDNGEFAVDVLSWMVQGTGQTGLNVDTVTDYNPFTIKIEHVDFLDLRTTMVLKQPIFLEAIMVPRRALLTTLPSALTFKEEEDVILVTQALDDNNTAVTNATIEARLMDANGNILVDFTPMTHIGDGVYRINFGKLPVGQYVVVYKATINNITTYGYDVFKVLSAYPDKRVDRDWR